MLRALTRRADALSPPAALAGLAIAIAPLAMGGVHVPTRVAVAALAVLALAWVGARIVSDGGRLELGLLGTALAVALGWTLLQWIPLPGGLVASLAPATAEAVQATATALGQEAPGWYPLTMDAPRTAASALSLAAVLAVYLVMLNEPRRSVQLRLIRWTISIAVCVLVVGIAQTVLGAERIYGLYEPSIDLDDVQILKTTFVNPNHAAALFLVSACATFGLWLDARANDPRRSWYLGAMVLLCLGVVGSLSRANTVLLAASLLAIVGLVQWRHSGKQTARRVVRMTASLVCIAAIAVLLVDPQRWWAELRTILDPAKLLETEGPVACWRVGWQVVDAQPLVGVGHGAFSTMASARMVDWDLGFADYAHNAGIQAVADWGWPMALLAGGAFLLALAGLARRGVGDLESVGIIVGLIAVAVQNMVDFSLLMPGVAVPAACFAGFLAVNIVQPREADGSRGAGALSIRAPWSRVASAAIVAVAAVLAWDALAHDPDRWAKDLRRSLSGGDAPTASVEAMVQRHPADFRLFRLAAIQAQRGGEAALGLRLADRAVALAGREPETVRVRAMLRLAEMDVHGGAEDLARLANLGPLHLDRAADLVWSHRHLKGLAQATFQAHPGFALRAGRRLYVQNQSEAAERLFAWASGTFPEELIFREELAMLLSRKPDEAERLESLATRTLAEGGSLADPEQARRHQRAGYLIEGFHLESRGRHSDAYHMFLEAALLDESQNLRPLLEAGDALIALGEPERLGRVLPDLHRAAKRGGPSYLASYYRLSSFEAEARGDLRAALVAARSAIHHLPSNPSHHYRLAMLLEATGDERAATRARQRAALLRDNTRPGLIDWMNPHLAGGEDD